MRQCITNISPAYHHNQLMKYNYLIVGAGLFGAVFACQAKERGKNVLVIDRRSHIAGNAYTERIEGINVHRYGPHIFHTNDREVWDYMNAFASFNRFTNSPIANYNGEIYPLPFNMYTFNKLWGVAAPEEARKKIAQQREGFGVESAANLEDMAIALVGRDIYEKLIKEYSMKQWGRPCKELPAHLIKRLPLRFSYDNNYFNADYQGIPIGGYTKMIGKMLDGTDILLNTDYLTHRAELDGMCEKIIYTGTIDSYYGYRFGALKYRSVRFETETLDTENFQGCAVVNYTGKEVPWTRIIEHKWFEFGKDAAGAETKKTVISKEYSSEWNRALEPYYPVDDAESHSRYQHYKRLSENDGKVYFGGRLGSYRYYDMDQVVSEAFALGKRLL